ncbi:serine C-palmitoyltransferase [Mrakia frigida]|uniref:serine C-palmitoyltransferase n=1 Tax=Mrakia frigida TaxID=29902 RepID=UPI003FCBF84C
MNCSVLEPTVLLEAVSPHPFEDVLVLWALFVSFLQRSFTSLPGSPIIRRYVVASYENDPYRTMLEIAIAAFALRTILSSRTRTDRTGRNFVQLSEKEIDELVSDWTPDPLVPAVPEDSVDNQLLASLPIIVGPTGPRVRLASNEKKEVLNLASYNFAGLAMSERLKKVATDTLRAYGVGTCSAPGFLGTIDVHTALEANISSFLQVPSTILYAQDFSAISSVIPSFAKRGDIIVADRLCNFSIQRGLQLSRSTVKYYDHGDMSSLEAALSVVAREGARKGARLTRRFIVTEGLFENDGSITDLEKIIELKRKYKFRLILDEGMSFGVIGATGRGLTEFSGVPATEVDIIVGSLTRGLNAGGGFCSGTLAVTSHQRINSAAHVFSASLPALLATTASEGISILSSSPQIFTTLQEHVKLARSILDKVESKYDLIRIPSHPLSPLIHIQLPTPPFGDLKDIQQQERLLQEVVEECLTTSGVMITRTRRLPDQEVFQPQPSIKLALSSGLTKKEVERSMQGVKAALIKVLGSKKR